MIYVIEKLVERIVDGWRRENQAPSLVTSAPSLSECPLVTVALPVSRNGQAHSMPTLARAASLFFTLRATDRLHGLRYVRLIFSGSVPLERWCLAADFRLLNDHGLAIALADCHDLLGETIASWELPEVPGSPSPAADPPPKAGGDSSTVGVHPPKFTPTPSTSFRSFP